MKLSPGHHSLPRKKMLLDGKSNSSSTQQQFQRGQALRRSCLSPTQYHHHHHQQQQHHHQHRQQESSLHFEYFVPRSVSEFNLAAAVTDIAVPPPPASVLRPSSAMTPPVAAGVAVTVAGTSQTRLLDNTSGNTARSREKMVTFEDEGVSCVTSTPTRKNLSGMDNIFM